MMDWTGARTGACGSLLLLAVSELTAGADANSLHALPLPGGIGSRRTLLQADTTVPPPETAKPAAVPPALAKTAAVPPATAKTAAVPPATAKPAVVPPETAKPAVVLPPAAAAKPAPGAAVAATPAAANPAALRAAPVPAGEPNATDIVEEAVNKTVVVPPVPVSTIFAPTDAAFEELATALNLTTPLDLFNTTFNETIANITALHVVPGLEVTSANLTVTPTITVPSLLGYNITVTREPTGNITVTIPGSDVVATVLTPDVPYNNVIMKAGPAAKISALAMGRVGGGAAACRNSWEPQPASGGTVSRAFGEWLYDFSIEYFGTPRMQDIVRANPKVTVLMPSDK
ncbi:hypothetical protein VOLCADRAFT_99437 [Volvox carteri f. nagariensis]|uniref:FAS1 domain-containing protein n=1 Tax=Volvox carteri f. nagariensis TaxID=3068 RepID=D8UHT1_VOLCA|nr:uncharacterized protein VOLCADRAFT_99437 [Volvox carteri f. nagariensis]EFJ40739.1 hypothetical protein VOLCADRAFT_99437 [Volvox carteri f. nagariensis]|eukprot:XP_002958205.1 hypothetical protein VOLCADRAFT_99437 [Volvox carteri f. nagariensis]